MPLENKQLKPKKRDTSGRQSLIFLLVGVAVICALAYLKIEGKGAQRRLKDEWREDFLAELTHPTPRSAHPFLELESDGQRFFISERPVSNREFFRFVQATSYQTWREQRDYSLNWRTPEDTVSWEDCPNAPARWLVPSDALAYCRWLAAELQQVTGPEGLRLPTVAELKLLPEKDDGLWEWTCETLYSHDSSRQRNRDYYCAWRGASELQYRREDDLGWPDTEPAGFRICWAGLEQGLGL